MSDIRRLKQNRATIKGQMTRINLSLNKEGNISVSEAKVKSKKIESLWESFEQVQAKIDELRTGDDAEVADSNLTEQDDAERQLFENIYFETATKIQTIIDLAQTQAQVISQEEALALRGAVQAENRNNNEIRQEQGNRRLDIKLPTLKLPEFSGS